MKRKADAARAAEFASVAKKTGGVFVFASRDANFPHQENASAVIAQHKFAAHRCRSCASEFSHVRAQGYQPYCVTCGSEEVDIGNDVNLDIPTDDKLNAVVCGTCNTIHAFQAEVASMGHVHCASCGSKIKTAAEADADPGNDLPANPGEMNPGDAETADDLDLTTLDDDEDETADLFDSTDDTEQFPEGLDAPVDTGISNQVRPDDEGASNADDSMQEMDVPSTQKSTPDGTVPPADGTSSETFPHVPNSQSEVAEDDTEVFEVDLVDDTEENEVPTSELSFSYSGNRVSILSGVKVIATLTPEHAGTNADLLQTEAFRMSVGHTIEKSGLKKALAHFNFQPVKISVPVTKVIAQRVEAKVKTQREKVEAANAEYAAAFGQALDIAAAGFAANFWRDQKDPVKAALVTELQSLGIRSASKIVNRVFAAHGVAQQRAVLEKARALAGRPVDALNSLSDAIDMARYTPVTSGTKVQAAEENEEQEVPDHDADSEDEDDHEEARFATVATPVVQSQNGRSAESASVYRSPEIRRLFGNSSIFSR